MRLGKTLTGVAAAVLRALDAPRQTSPQKCLAAIHYYSTELDL